MNLAGGRRNFTAVLNLIFIVSLSNQLCHAFASPKSKFRTKPNFCFKNLTDSAALSNLPTKCITLNHPYCLNIELPYASIYIPDNVPGRSFNKILDVQDYISRWQEVQRIPKCWTLLQTTLCSIFMPQCNEDTVTSRATSISKPSADLCADLVNRGNCRFIERHFNWSTLFNCTDTNIYQKNCTNDIPISQQKLECHYPLVSSTDPKFSFKDIDGCDLHCKFPVIDPIDQSKIRYSIALCCTICVFLIGFALILFICNLNFNKSSRIAKTIIWNNIFQFLHFVGWSLQFISRSDIACTPEGAKLQDLTLMANLCVLSFILTYFSTISSLFWYTYLGKLCFEKLNSGERRSARPNNKLDPTFCWVSFTIPSILLIIVAFFGKIDGHGVYGICTVGQQSLVLKAIFLFIPLVIGVLWGNLYFFRTIYNLSQVKVMRPERWRNLSRFIALVVLTFLFLVTTITNHINEHVNQAKWTDAIDKHIACSLNIRALYDYNGSGTEQSKDCTIESKPNVVLYCMEVLCTFAIGFVMSTWSFCEQNLRALRRALVNCLEDELDRKRRTLPNLDKSGAASGLVGAYDETFKDPIDMAATPATNAAVASGATGNDLESHNDDRPPSVSSKTISFMESRTNYSSLAPSFSRQSIASRRLQVPPPITSDSLPNPQSLLNSHREPFLDNLTVNLVHLLPTPIDQMELASKLASAAMAAAATNPPPTSPALSAVLQRQRAPAVTKQPAASIAAPIFVHSSEQQPMQAVQAPDEG